MEIPEQSLEHFRSAAEALKSFSFLPHSNIADILFVSQGLKPAAEFEMSFQDNTPAYPREEFEKNLDQMRRIFSELQLTYNEEPSHDKETGLETVMFRIAQSEVAKEALVVASAIEYSSEYTRARGKALGIPDTAVEAFAGGKTGRISHDELPEEVQKDRALRFANFILSKDHWREELESVRGKMQKIDEILPGYFEGL